MRVPNSNIGHTKDTCIVTRTHSSTSILSAAAIMVRDKVHAFTIPVAFFELILKPVRRQWFFYNMVATYVLYTVAPSAYIRCNPKLRIRCCACAEQGIAPVGRRGGQIMTTNGHPFLTKLMLKTHVVELTKFESNLKRHAFLRQYMFAV